MIRERETEGNTYDFGSDWYSVLEELVANLLGKDVILLRVFVCLLGFESRRSNAKLFPLLLAAGEMSREQQEPYFDLVLLLGL